MKGALKLIMYSAIVVSFFVASLLIFKSHPEVQLAFLLPGVLILIYSKIRDEVYMSTAMRLRYARGR